MASKYILISHTLHISADEEAAPLRSASEATGLEQRIEVLRAAEAAEQEWVVVSPDPKRGTDRVTQLLHWDREAARPKCGFLGSELECSLSWRRQILRIGAPPRP